MVCYVADRQPFTTFTGALHWLQAGRWPEDGQAAITEVWGGEVLRRWVVYADGRQPRRTA